MDEKKDVIEQVQTFDRALTVDRAVAWLRENDPERAEGVAALYDWFLEKDSQGAVLPRPMNVKPCIIGDTEQWLVEEKGGQDLTALEAPDAEQRMLKLQVQRGIHKPHGCDYAVAIILKKEGLYGTEDEVSLADGTKVILYRPQAKGEDSQRTNQGVYNQALCKCIAYGLPVCVQREVGESRYSFSLYFVTDFSVSSGVFTLQGPVRSASDNRFGMTSDEGPLAFVREPDVDFIAEFANRKRVKVDVASRSGQSGFRKSLVRAYDGRCAVTGCDIGQVLEAAHVWQHYGEKSQTVSHGILLRADVHRLYDHGLCAVDPDTFVFRLSEEIKDSRYQQEYGDKRIGLPRDANQWPSHEELEVHFKQFSLAG